MVGNKTNAKKALGIYQKSNSLTGRIKNMPEGWKYLGSGISRAVYLGPDNIAYKVSKGDGWSNNKEHKKSVDLNKNKKSLPSELVIPKTTLYENGKVLAMEFVEISKTKRYNWDCQCSDGQICTKLRCFERVEAMIIKYTGLWDFHHKNCLIGKDGRYYMVDLVT